MWHRNWYYEWLGRAKCCRQNVVATINCVFFSLFRIMDCHENMWKEIFLKLFNNKDQNPLPISSASQSCWLVNSFNVSSYQSFASFPNSKVRLITLSAKASTISDLVEQMATESMFEDEVWRRIIFIIRDRESKPLYNKKKLPVTVGTWIIFMNISDLEQK